MSRTMALFIFRDSRLSVITLLWLVLRNLFNSTRKKFFWFILFCVVLIAVMMMSQTSILMRGHYAKWMPSEKNRKPQPSKVFVHGAYDDIFIYSAIANDRQPHNNDLNVIVSSLDKTYASFQCCFLLSNKTTVYVTPAYEYFSHFTNRNSFIDKLLKYYDPGTYRAHQHSCFLPDTGHQASHVTLTSSLCSSNVADYVAITYPPNAYNKLALCAKIAHSGGIDPEKFIEWAEIQRILGVDKILVFDLGNPAPLTRVFRYYQDLGFLDVQPYELPGHPQRSLRENMKFTRQFNHDETLTVLDCRQRMGGYTFVLSHDVDEFIIPRQDVDLKTFLKKKMETHLDSAGFFFYAEFFIYGWQPTNPEEDLMVTRFRKATLPHWECTKYVYLPSRVQSTVTHDIHPHRPFQTYRISPDEAVLHHYRHCPDVWRSCHPPTIIDNIMTRFSNEYNLLARVKKVREATKVQPAWS